MLTQEHIHSLLYYLESIKVDAWTDMVPVYITLLIALLD